MASSREGVLGVLLDHFSIREPDAKLPKAMI